MGIFDRLFRRGHRRANAVTIALDPVMHAVHRWAAVWEDDEVDVPLTMARLADRCRSAAVAPPDPDNTALYLMPLPLEGRRRFAASVEVLSEAVGDQALSKLFVKGDTLLGRLGELIEATDALSLELVRQSPLRVEEFSRHLLARLGAEVEGEPPEASQARLERLDYATLLKEAERAKASSEDRLEYLRKLQEDLDARFQPRGKW